MRTLLEAAPCGKRLEKIKDAFGNSGDDNVSIDSDTGDVCDPDTGDPMGNLYDEDD